MLDERKTKILQAIIRNYLETGEPVGSRTISKYTDLNLSSATIRNEMADLEELGYILQPHTSAGRIPSDKGYRFYVDYMMEQKEREVVEMKEMLVERQDKMEQVLKKVAKFLAQNTQYATMISALIAFTALIPFAGAYIGSIVGAFMILTVSPGKALLFLIFIIVLQQLEGNLIYPRVVGSSLGLPPLWVLAAITVGGGMFGIIGMLLGVPLTATLYRIIRADIRNGKVAPSEAPKERAEI